MLNKEKIITFVKDNRMIYVAYYYVMSFLIKILKLFVVPDSKLILFVSYGGRYFNESPRCLYDRMKMDSRFKGYKLVWAFRNPSQFKEVEFRIKIDSLKYYITALKARCWITNVHIERGLDFKGKKTFYFNTTHTLLPKVTGSLINRKSTFTSAAKSKCDCYSVQCELEREIMENEKDKVLIVGYPKSDILANYTKEYRKELREKLGFSDDNKVILYAPTYREGSLSGAEIPVNFDLWESILGNGYRVMFRAHPVFAKKININEVTGFVKDVSDYPDNNDLIIASDILISDYSGIFFEYGVQNKPMFCYAYDYDEYTKIRPLYFDIRESIPGGFMNECELMNYIKSGSEDDIKNMIDKFRAQYIQEYGHATESCLEIIYNSIN